MKNRFVSATEFKAKCLAILDEIDKDGGRVTATKRGRAIAILGSAKKRVWKSPFGVLTGKIEIVGDIENADTSDLWDVVSGGSDVA